MLDGVLDAVVTALEAKGIRAAREFPDTAAELSDTQLCVGAESCKCLSSGLGDYLGLRRGAEGECGTELYGRRLELCLRIAVMTPYSLPDAAAACSETAHRLGELLSGLPSGLVRQRLELGELRADEDAECFCCLCRLYCTAYMLAESSGVDGEFLDFILKGTVKHGD